MKNYYYNPKTQDLMIFDTENNQIDVLEILKGIRVITSSEIRNGSEDEPVRHWKNSAYDPADGKAHPNYDGPSSRQRKAKVTKVVKKCGYCHKTDHAGKNCPNKPAKDGQKSARTVHCKKCGGAGHMTKTCPKVSSPTSEELPAGEIEKIAREERAEEPIKE